MQNAVKTTTDKIKFAAKAVVVNMLSNPTQAMLAFALTIFYQMPFSSNLNFDVRGEFSGYMLLFGLLLFLFVQSNLSEKVREDNELPLLSYLFLIVSLFHFLIFKTFIIPGIVMMLITFLTVFLFLLIVKKIYS